MRGNASSDNGNGQIAMDARFMNHVQQIPVAMAILKGKDHVVEIANARMLELWGKTADQVMEKPVFEGIPEAKGQGLEELLGGVFSSGEKFEANERPVQLYRNGKLTTCYLNFVYEPFIEEADGKITGIVAVATDVTPQVLSRTTIEEGYIFNQTVLESSPDCVKVLDLDGKLTFINQNGVCTLEGPNKDFFINKKWASMWGEANQHAVLNAIEKAVQGKTSHFTAFSPTLKNTPKWWDIIVTPVTNVDGKVTSILATSRDVTERSVAAKELEQSANRFNHLIYSSPYAIGILYGNDLTITIANDAILEIWGKGRDIIGKPYFDALPELAEQGFGEIFREVYKTGVPFNAVESPINIVQNGEMVLKYYNFLLFPQRDDKNSINGIGIIATEVTSQALLNSKIKESEEKFAAAVQAVEGIMWTNNAIGEMEGPQLGWAELTGQTQEEYQGYGWANAVHPEDVEPTIEAWNEAVNEIKTFNFEHRIKTKEGNWRSFGVKAIPIKNEDGTIREWVGVHTDIHQQKTFAIELKKQVQERTKELELKNVELERMNKELQSFAYISSHDLQEPLRKIQTFSSRIFQLEYEKLSDKGKEMFERMSKSANRMQTLIDDLLGYSRTSTAERKFEFTDLNAIVEEVKADLKEDLQQANATIVSDKLCEINIIPFQFRQLLHNLISNSLKFASTERQPQIKIESEKVLGSATEVDALLPNMQYCHIRIEDNGIGFDQEYSNKIFELFQRLHGRSEYKGTGIGLAIVKKIVENHSGIITANGELNKGATFDIYLPNTKVK